MSLRVTLPIVLVVVTILAFVLIQRSSSNAPVEDLVPGLEPSSETAVPDPVRSSGGTAVDSRPNRQIVPELTGRDPTGADLAAEGFEAAEPVSSRNQNLGLPPEAGDTGIAGSAPEAGEFGDVGLAPEAGELDIEYGAPEAGVQQLEGSAPEASDPGVMGPAPEDSN